MIDVEKELEKYVLRVWDVDPRAPAALTKANITLQKLGTLGGDCCWTTIRLNADATDEHQRETLGHELAHLLDHVLFNGRGHGYGWAFWMTKLGLDPKRKTHDHEELIRNHPGPIYQCECADCGKRGVYPFNPRNCQDSACLSPDVRVTRADGFTGRR